MVIKGVDLEKETVGGLKKRVRDGESLGKSSLSHYGIRGRSMRRRMRERVTREKR